MLALNNLLPKRKNKNNTEIEEQYVKVSSLIEEGSVLDRRKLSDDRRKILERRLQMRQNYEGVEKRSNEDRRCTPSRREAEVHDENLSGVRLLVHDQNEAIKTVKQLSIQAKNDELGDFKETIKNIYAKINNVTDLEENLLRECFHKNVKKSNSKSEKTLTELLFYVHDASDQVTEYLNRYYSTEVSDINVGFFILDMNTVHDSMKLTLEKKQEHLYPMFH